MAGANAFWKKEEKEIINDLYTVFSPMDERVSKGWVKYVYGICFNALKDKPYLRERMSLAKVLAATQLEKFVSGEMEAEAAAEAKALLAAEGVVSEGEVATTEQVKTKFVD